MREGVRPKTKLHVIGDMCVMLRYVMLCVRLLRSWQVGVSDHEKLKDDLGNRSKVWTVQS